MRSARRLVHPALGAGEVAILGAAACIIGRLPAARAFGRGRRTARCDGADPRGSLHAAPATNLTLVDGNALLYRAFFGTSYQGITNLHGEPEGALCGFTTMIIRIRKQLNTSHLAVMMDSDLKKAKRRQVFQEYKENRIDRTPPELWEQMQRMDEVCRQIHVPLRQQDGYEADDLIATYTWAAEESGGFTSVHIISPDKDLAQLVSNERQVWLHNVVHNPAHRLDAEGVRGHWGVKPEQICDLLALAGDPVDRIPGVTGIGLKKAADLLNAHGSLAKVLEVARLGRLCVPGIGPRLLQNILQEGPKAQEWLKEVVKLKAVQMKDATNINKEFKEPPVLGQQVVEELYKSRGWPHRSTRVSRASPPKAGEPLRAARPSPSDIVDAPPKTDSAAPRRRRKSREAS